MSLLSARALTMLAYVIFNLDATSDRYASDGLVAGNARACTRGSLPDPLAVLPLLLCLAPSRLCRMRAVAVSRPFDGCHRTIAHVGKKRRLLEGMEATVRSARRSTSPARQGSKREVTKWRHRVAATAAIY
jgi:hypothetical protein